MKSPPYLEKPIPPKNTLKPTKSKNEKSSKLSTEEKEEEIPLKKEEAGIVLEIHFIIIYLDMFLSQLHFQLTHAHFKLENNYSEERISCWLSILSFLIKIIYRMPLVYTINYPDNHIQNWMRRSLGLNPNFVWAELS